MADKPTMNAADMKTDGLKKTNTKVAGDAPDPAAVAAIAAQWQGTYEKTKASAAYSAIEFNAKWVEALKAKPAGEQATFFAEGVVTGLAFAA